MSRATRSDTKFATFVGAESLTALRALSTQQIFDAAAKPGAGRFPPAIDGYFLPKAPVEIFAALRMGGAFLVSVRDGAGETNNDYHMTYWRRDQFVARLTTAGLHLDWDSHSVDSDGDGWLTFLARRSR